MLTEKKFEGQSCQKMLLSVACRFGKCCYGATLSKVLPGKKVTNKDQNTTRWYSQKWLDILVVVLLIQEEKHAEFNFKVDGFSISSSVQVFLNIEMTIPILNVNYFYFRLCFLKLGFKFNAFSFKVSGLRTFALLVYAHATSCIEHARWGRNVDKNSRGGYCNIYVRT